MFRWARKRLLHKRCRKSNRSIRLRRRPMLWE